MPAGDPIAYVAGGERPLPTFRPYDPPTPRRITSPFRNADGTLKATPPRQCQTCPSTTRSTA